jgi:hypothetical protein
MHLVPASSRPGLVPELPIFGCWSCDAILKEIPEPSDRELT